MKLVLSLNNQNYMSDYISMGIDTYVLGNPYSFHAPYSFSLDEMKKMKEQYPQIHFYASLSALYDQHVISELEAYIDQLNEIGIDGIVFQDFGVLQIVKEKGYTFDMMYSPETLNTNVNTLNILHEEGVTSAFISKVIPLEEQKYIAKYASMPVMMFAHGVEYIAASKRALLSNYHDASQLDFTMDEKDALTIQAKNSKQEFYIYEDKKGTHIFSKTRLYTLDLMSQLEDFDYLYIETLMMNDQEAIEIASLYSDALHSYEKGTYTKDITAYKELLWKLKTPLDRGFLFDQTVYKLEDMRKIDNEKR